MILQTKEYEDYKKAMENTPQGIQRHLFFGHGATQNTFEKRDFGTTNDLMYGAREKIETITDPHVYKSDKG